MRQKLDCTCRQVGLPRKCVGREGLAVPFHLVLSGERVHCHG